MSPRRYSRSEVDQILTRAAAHEVRLEKDGLRLEEIEAAAAEAGMDVALVRKAAAELVPSADDDEFPPYGGWNTFYVYRTIPTRLDEAGIDTVLPALRPLWGGHFEATMVGSTLSVTSNALGVARKLTVGKTKDGTEVRLDVSQHRPVLAPTISAGMGTFLVAGGLFVVGVLGPFAALAASALGIVAGYLVACHRARSNNAAEYAMSKRVVVAVAETIRDRS